MEVVLPPFPHPPDIMKPKFFSRGTALPAIILLGTASLANAQTSTWTNNSGGLFSNAANWDNGSPSGAAFDAIIDDGDSAVSVTLDVTRTINDLTMGPDDSLLFNNNTSLTVTGDVSNNGLIQLNSIGNTTALNFSGAGNHTLSGSGILRLGDSANRIGGGAGASLVNAATHTIEGGGNVGGNVIGLNNLGLIRANQSGALMTIDPSAAGNLSNSGTLRAENGGSILLTGSGGGTFDNTGGTIEALAGSSVRFTTSADITGGTLSTTGNGSLSVDGGQTVFFTNLTNAGNLTIQNNSDLRLSGSIVNSGSISTNSIGNPTDILIQGGGVTLSGGGSVNFQSNSGINGGSVGGRLTNVDNMIRGSGNIGQNSAAITNSAAGVIAADISGQTLVLDPVATATDGSVSFINDGVLRASSGGTLLLTGSAGGDFTNNNLIQALDLSSVRFTADASVTGGTLSSTGTGQFVVNVGQNAFFTDITNSGLLIAENNSDLGISGTINNTGAIRLTSIGNQTDLEIQAGGATLTGGGSVTLADITTGINSPGSGIRFTNFDNTIQGIGTIGRNVTAITNAAGGLIDANGAGSLTLDPVATASDGGTSFLNDGILRARSGGTMILTGSAGGAFTNNNRIEALDGSEIQLTSGASVTGGTLATSDSGLFRANANQDVFLDNLTLNGNLIADNNTDLGIAGGITNTGSITLTSIGNQSDLEIQAGGATLDGGGTVTFADSTTGLNSALGARFTNVDNTLQGQGPSARTSPR